MADDDLQLFVPGTFVRIEGLTGAPQYNNQTGVIQSFHPDTGRYQVELRRRNHNNQILGVKPERLVPLCSTCQTKNANLSQAACPRCGLPYCSKDCRDGHWETHKKDCVPKILPEAPGPVQDADRGDVAFDAAQEYLQMAVDAGRDGYVAEEVALLERLIAKDEKQPVAFFNLFQRARTRDLDQAWAYLQKTAALLTDPQLILGSDPQGVSDFPTQVRQSWSMNLALMLVQGMDFIREHRVVGYKGDAVQPVATVLEQFVQLLDQIDTEDFDLWERSTMYFELGNIYRKMDDKERAHDNLMKAENVLTPWGRHNFEALLMAAELCMSEIRHAQTPEEVETIIDGAIEMSRAINNGMQTEEPEHSYAAEIQLACFLYNLHSLVPSRRNPQRLLEMHQLASSALPRARAAGEEDLVSKASKILSEFRIQMCLEKI